MPTPKQNSRLTLMIAALLFGILAVSACSSQPTPAATQESAPAADEIDQSAEVAPTDMPAELPTATETVDAAPMQTELPEDNGEQPGEGYPAPGYQFPTPTTNSGAYPYPAPEQAAPPPVKTELEATNPAMVVLASGKPQLIEFFAFW